MINRLKWFGLMALVAGSVACGGGPSDDEQLKDLDQDEREALCEDACDGAEAYSLECMEDGVTITSSRTAEEASACQSNCVQFTAVKDSCTVTAGDVRTIYSVPQDCSESEAQLDAAIELQLCQ